MIQFKCSECGKQLRVENSAAGRKGKCPQCGAIVRVPKEEMVALEEAEHLQTPPASSAGVEESTSASEQETDPTATPKGIDGWLHIPAIRLVISRIRAALRFLVGLSTVERTIIWVVAIVATAGVVGCWVWSSHNRYYIMVGSNNRAYEVDRKTGKTWALGHQSKTALEDPAFKDKPERILPYAEKAKVTGRAGLRYGSFSGSIYNGSTWVITRLVINVWGDTPAGKRDFSVNVKIRPLQTGRISIDSIINVVGITGTEGHWYIKEVYGYQE